MPMFWHACPIVSYPETQDILCHQGVHASLLGESRVRDPSLGPRPPPFWRFLPFESILHHVSCSTHPKMTLTA